MRVAVFDAAATPRLRGVRCAEASLLQF